MKEKVFAASPLYTQH